MNGIKIVGSLGVAVMASALWQGQRATFATSKSPASPAALTRSRDRAARVRTRYEAVLSLERKGDIQAARAGYEAILRDPETGRRDAPIRLSYGQMLEEHGDPRTAMAVVQPLVFQSVPQSLFAAVEVYERALRQTQGPGALRAFRDRIRDNSLDGFSLRHYNGIGLDDDDAMHYIRGGYAEGKGDWATAEWEYRKILPDHPPCLEFYASVKGVLYSLHRKQEVIPLFEDWYRHSSPATRAMIKQYCFLDYARLDAQQKP